MRRLVPLLILALLVVPAQAGAAAPKVRVHATDAAAMKALAAAARKLEGCRTLWLDYNRCDVRALEAKGALLQESSSGTYVLVARSRPGRSFRLVRGMDGSLAATCTPAGRGACPRSGIWKPKPRPVMNPAYGTEWLPNERQVVAHLEALVAAVDACAAATGTRTGCTSDPSVAAAREALQTVTWDRVELFLDAGYSHHVHATAGSSTVFAYTWTPDRGGSRDCQKYLPHYVSPCVDGRW